MANGRPRRGRFVEVFVAFGRLDDATNATNPHVTDPHTVHRPHA